MEYTPTITGKTKLVGLIGSPVAHSMSPAIHTASFAHEGVDAIYIAFDVLPDQCEELVPMMEVLGVVGYNVTLPHKTKILPYLDELTPAAELIGAVNTVIVKGDRSVGHNTDGEGYTVNLRRNGFEPKGKTVTLLGAGGAGSAIYTQFALDGAQKFRYLISGMNSGILRNRKSLILLKKPTAIFRCMIFLIRMICAKP